MNHYIYLFQEFLFTSEFDLQFFERLFDEVVRIAKEDNIITPDERAILETTRKNIDKFNTTFKDAMADEILTVEEIKALEIAYRKVYYESESEAIKDNILTTDEVKLISKIAHTLFSP